MRVAAVLAGGKGLRMGTDVPKQYLEILGIPVIIRSINAFIKNSEIDMCIVSVGADFISYVEDLIKKHISTDKEIFVIEGGKTRGDTLLSVLEFMNDKSILSDSIILTHDAVRPFITDRIISDNIRAAEKYGACNTCVTAVDTILISSDGEFIESVPERSTVFHAQTPQSFDAKKLYELIKKMSRDDFERLTDGCSVFSFFNERVNIVQGENFNIKITYPDDIKRAEDIIKQYFN